MNRLAFLLNRTLPYYRKTIEELRPDLIHAHFGYDGYKLLSLSESLNIPLLISFYGSDVSRLPGEAGWKKRYRKMARSTARFVAASEDRKSTRLNSSHVATSYAVFCLKKKRNSQ